MAEVDVKKLLALLGLANRAGKLALGFSAVEKLVRRRQRPLVVVASDAGASQRSRVDRWEPVAGVLPGVMSGSEMARALGRDKLTVVGVSDPGFIKGIKKLMA